MSEAAERARRGTLAFDHRVFDGAEAKAFFGDLRDRVEAPELALL